MRWSIASFLLGGATTFALTVNRFSDTSHPRNFTGLLLLLILLQVLRYQRLWVGREVLLCVASLGYSLLSLIWTNDLRTAGATLPNFLMFALTAILLSALVFYHELRSLLAGALAGFVAGAALYTLTSHFPLTYPEDFSYNTIAGMYLFGLVVTVIFGAYRRLTLLPIALGVPLMVLIAATTSIKTNLGVLLGTALGGLLYLRVSVRGIVRIAIPLAVITTGIAYVVMTNSELSGRVQYGVERVGRGVAVLTNREGDSGKTGIGQRQAWTNQGLKGWMYNPVFGYGVEAFRSGHGTTSHSTPVDLLYNSGVIGFGLFYAIFISIAVRLMRARDGRLRAVRARIAAALICYGFISLSGLIYYDPLVAAFIGISAALLARSENVPIPAPSATARIETRHVPLSV